MSADFGYINARVRGLKAHLLGANFYGEVLNASDFSAFTSVLSQSPYMHDVEEAQAREQGLGLVDEALARNFDRISRSILNFSDGRAHELIALFLLRYDLANIKALARAKHAERDSEEVMSVLLPAGELKLTLLEAMAAAPDMPSMAQVLAVSQHPLGRAMNKAAAQYAQDSDLFALELTLDQAYFSVLFEGLERLGAGQPLVRHMQREVDATNLRTALKLRDTGTPKGEIFVRGGREISRELFTTLLGSEGAAALQELAGTSFAGVAEAEGLSAAEEVIRATLNDSAKRLSLTEPESGGLVLYYLRAKEAEAARLRLLARGKYYHIPRAQLEQELGHA